MAGQDLTSKSVPIASKGFNGGLNSTASPLTVAQNESSKLLNIDFDKFGSVMKRNGYTRLAGNYEYGTDDAYTTLLMHMEGNNNSTIFADSSSRGNTVTACGSAKISTSAKKFGNSSGYFNGTTDYLTMPSDQKLTNGSFETWTAGDSVAPDGWTLSGAGAAIAKESTTFKVGKYSAKLTRNGTNCYLNQDIESLGGHPLSYWKGRTITFGCWVYVGEDLKQPQIGINDGVTATVANHSTTSGWEYLTATHTVSSSATILVARLYAYTNDMTAYFDGAFVTDDAAANFNFLDDDFTIDCWVYLNSISDTMNIIRSGTYTTNNAGSFGFQLAPQVATNQIRLYFNNDGRYSVSAFTAYYATYSFSINTWYHLEVCRSGNNILFFVNGVLKSTTATSGSLYPSDELVYVGTNSLASAYFNGYIDEFRVSKGIARHTANFTVETDAYDIEYQDWPVTALKWFEMRDGTNYLLSVINDKLYSNQLSSTLTDITGNNLYDDDDNIIYDDDDTEIYVSGGITITAGNLFSHETFYDRAMFTNGVDAPFYWDGSGTAEAMTLPTDISLPKWIKQFMGYVFFANSIVDGKRQGSRLNWSVINNPDSWNDPDFAYISWNDGQDISGLGVLGDRLVIFKDRSIWIGQFTGDVDVPFQFQKTQSHVGCVSGYSIQNVANGLVFMGEDGIYFFDGNQSEKLSNRLNTTIYANNKVRMPYTVSMYQKFKNRTWFSQCESGQTESSQVITWDDYNNAFSLYNGMAPCTMCMCYSSGEEIPVFGDYHGQIYRADSGSDDYPLNVQTAIDGYFYTKWIDYDDLTNSKGLVQLDVYFQYNNATLNVVYAYNFEDGDTYTLPINTSGGVSLWDVARWDVDTWGGSGGGHYRLDLTGRGRVVRIGFKNDALGETFRVDGIGQMVHLETNQ